MYLKLFELLGQLRSFGWSSLYHGSYLETIALMAMGSCDIMFPCPTSKWKGHELTRVNCVHCVVVQVSASATSFQKLPE